MSSKILWWRRFASCQKGNMNEIWSGIILALSWHTRRQDNIVNDMLCGFECGFPFLDSLLFLFSRRLVTTSHFLRFCSHDCLHNTQDRMMSYHPFSCAKSQTLHDMHAYKCILCVFHVLLYFPFCWHLTFSTKNRVTLSLNMRCYKFWE